jgi:pimeloyl-ACP methyl ester carboxylesterase
MATKPSLRPSGIILQQPVRAIDTPTLVVDGDHDVAIKREHTEYIAATIPNAGLLILPNVSHFAFLQDPKLFTFAILHFLGDE